MLFLKGHSARVKDPKLFERIRDITEAMRKKGWKLPVGVRVLGGSLKKGGFSLQAWRFDKSKWTAGRAKRWLKDNDHGYTLFSEASTAAQAAAAGSAYRCECLDCGRIVESDEHCRLVRCPKCGGEMRRVERPGPGQRSAQASAALAAVPENLAFEILAEEVSISAAVAEGEDEPKLPRFSMLAYSGGGLAVNGWQYPVYISLAGMATQRDQVTMLKDHVEEDPVGYADRADVHIDEKMLRLDGVISGTGEAARRVVGDAANGYKWGASIGARTARANVVFVEEGMSARVNGRSVPGPCYIWTKSLLVEVSFLSIPADGRSSVRIAARAAETEGGRQMSFEEWLKTKGKSTEGIDEKDLAALKNQYEAEQTSGDNSSAEDDNIPSPPVKKPAEEPPAKDPAGDDPAAAGEPVEKLKARMRAAADDVEREIALFREYGDQVATKKLETIKASARKDKWAPDRIELELMRAARPGAPAIHDRGTPLNALVLEAALRFGSGENEEILGQAYGDEIASAARKLRNIGLRDTVALCCRLDGVSIPGIGASPQEWAQAAFSTSSLPNLLDNTANKVLMTSFEAVPTVARLVSRKLSAKNFQTHTGYRLGSKKLFQGKGKGGELKHTSLGEDGSFSYLVTTKGVLLGITREDIINDSLGAFLEVPRLLGQDAAETVEYDFWTLVLANTGNFISAGNGNYITGAGTVLGIGGLDLAEKAFGDMQSGKGVPISILAKYLAVPTALGGTARSLYVSTKVQGSTSKEPDGNAYAGKYQPMVSPYLGNTAFHASASSTAWLLFADPNGRVAAFGIAYLNGQENPVVEEVTPDPRYLGKTWRAYLDYGACQIDKQGVVKSKGSV